MPTTGKLKELGGGGSVLSVPFFGDCGVDMKNEVKEFAKSGRQPYFARSLRILVPGKARSQSLMRDQSCNDLQAIG